jgi:hypothetical protein
MHSVAQVKKKLSAEHDRQAAPYDEDGPQKEKPSQQIGRPGRSQLTGSRHFKATVSRQNLCWASAWLGQFGSVRGVFAFWELDYFFANPM